MKLTLTNIALRPFKTAKKVIQLLKSVEMVPVVNATPFPKNWEKTIDTTTVFVRIENANIVIPYDLYKHLEPHIVRLDYDFHGSTRHWKLHAEQKVTTAAMHINDLTAMRVAEKLEK